MERLTQKLTKLEVIGVDTPIFIYEIVTIDRDVARVAAQLRARFDIRPPDALRVAASLVTGARGFLTNDRRLSGLQSLTEIIVLDD